jgi:hypothetical protein
LSARAAKRRKRAPCKCPPSQPPADPAAEPASAPATEPAPLQIDDETLRRAARASRRATAQMAERSGQFEDVKRSSSERLAASIEHASMPDCARLDALKHAPLPLGGLLGLPMLGYIAAKGLCK